MHSGWKTDWRRTRWPPTGATCGNCRRSSPACDLLAAGEADLQQYFAATFACSRASTANRRWRRCAASTLGAARGMIDRDPTLRLAAAKAPPRFPKSLTEEQVEALLAAPMRFGTRPARPAMLEMLYATGLRAANWSA